MPAPSVAFDPCKMMLAPAPGPLAAEVAAAGGDALKIAQLRLREAQQTSDAGFYNLVQVALDCAQQQDSTDPSIRQLQAHVLLQDHRFAEVEALQAKVLDSGLWMDQMLYGDALFEQGKLDGAAGAYQAAVNLRPNILIYERIGALRQAEGDLLGAEEMFKMAASAGVRSDPEPLVWVWVRLGWLHALMGQPTPELEMALHLLPHHAAAHAARGRLRLFGGDRVGALSDLREAGGSFEVLRALKELGEDVDLEGARGLDPRGYAIYKMDAAPSVALPILEAELKIRQDVTTRMAWVYTRFRLGEAVGEEARAILASQSLEPRVLLWGGKILGDAALLEKAKGPGLLPSEF